MLACEEAQAISSLAWSPDGRQLAAASTSSPGFTIWDVAYQACQRVSAGALCRCSNSEITVVDGGVGTVLLQAMAPPEQGMSGC